METYSFGRGVAKGLISLLSVTGALLTFSGFFEITLWDLVVQYVKPLLGSLTVGAVITVAINWLKFQYKLGKVAGRRR